MIVSAFRCHKHSDTLLHIAEEIFDNKRVDAGGLFDSPPEEDSLFAQPPSSVSIRLVSVCVC